MAEVEGIEDKNVVDQIIVATITTVIRLWTQGLSHLIRTKHVLEN